jgi:hypothetical protein
MKKRNGNPPVYLCAGPEAWGLKDYSLMPGTPEHRIANCKGRILVWPKQLDEKSINPGEMAELKTELKSERILIADRMKGNSGLVFIRDHVNRSGLSYLRGNTPFGNQPMFPDVSRIYLMPSNVPSVVIHTLGPVRFAEISQTEKTIWSEAAGIVAPVLFYVGLLVYAVGGAGLTEILRLDLS